MLLEVVGAHFRSEDGAREAAAAGGVPDAAELAAGGEAAATRLEAAIFEAHGKGLDEAPDAAYAEQFKTLASNFKRNVPLTLGFFQGDIGAARLARMTSAELQSDAARKQAEAARREAQEAVQLDWLLKNRGAMLASAGMTASEGMLTCPKCKKRNTTYYQKQTRSADEPMTTFASCLNDTCLFRWRFC